jgi:hypothetical protein
MSRQSPRFPTVEEVVAMWGAEDRAHHLLAKLPRQEAVISSVKVASALAELWEIEAEAMMRRGDPRYVFKSRLEERSWLASAVAACSQNSLWQHCPTEQVQASLAILPPDEAAHAAYLVARSVCRGERFR